MNASKAVEFVFRGRHEQRVDSSKCLPTKTLVRNVLIIRSYLSLSQGHQLLLLGDFLFFLVELEVDQM